jgi:hypothetical protein
VVEAGQLVDLALPVVPILPVAANLLEKFEADAVFPCGAGNFVWPAGAGEAVAKIVDGELGEGKDEGCRLQVFCCISAATCLVGQRNCRDMA